MNDGKFLIYTCANNGYEDFAPLLIASSLWTNDAALVEVGVPNSDDFLSVHSTAIQVLERFFAGRFRISSVEFPDSSLPHTVRFVNQPAMTADYVYIADCDLIFLDPNFPSEHLKFMREQSLPYANSLRDRDRRLTGLHFSEWGAYYPIPDSSDLDLRRTNDEQVLAELVHRRGHRLHQTPWFRPVPGIHPSPNRQPAGRSAGDGKPSWGEGPWLEAWQKFRQSSIMEALKPNLRGYAADAVRELDEMHPAKNTNTSASPVQARFEKVFSDNHWQNVESVSGGGSTKAATKELVPQLIALFDRLNIRVVNDAPCGDFNWISPVVEQREYRGFDIVEGVLEIARTRSSSSFTRADITSDILPEADLILCRDCLVHLPDDLAIKAIGKLCQSGSTWLLTTTFPDVTQNIKGSLGGWRPINLELEPFSLKAPDEMIIERPSAAPHEKFGRKALGLWRLTGS